jgi:hypothetical protein
MRQWQSLYPVHHKVRHQPKRHRHAQRAHDDLARQRPPEIHAAARTDRGLRPNNVFAAWTLTKSHRELPVALILHYCGAGANENAANPVQMKE